MKTYQNIIAGITLAFGLLLLSVLRYVDAGAEYYILPGLTVVACGVYFTLPLCYDVNVDKPALDTSQED